MYLMYLLKMNTKHKQLKREDYITLTQKDIKRGLVW
jgi:hypothetical protein